MGYAIETVNATLSAAAVTTEQLLIAGSGQSLSVRAAAAGANILLDSVWGDLTVAAFLSIRSPRMHDNVKGVLVNVLPTSSNPVLNEGFGQQLYSQDTLTLGLTFPVAPGAASLQHVGFNIVYSDLPGVAAPMRTWAEVEPNILEYMGLQTVPTTGASPGSWGPGVNLASTFDTLKANELYAVVGYEVSALATAVALQGPDTGNLLVGGPAPISLFDTRYWFKQQSDLLGMPYIPVINSANKNSTLANVCAPVGATAFTINWLLAHLRS